MHLVIAFVGLTANVRAAYDSPCTQGWVLNELWKSDEGLQKNSSSILSVRYSTGDGLKLNGLCFNLEVRHALLALVLINISGSNVDKANGLLQSCRLNYAYDTREDNTVNWQEI